MSLIIKENKELNIKVSKFTVDTTYNMCYMYRVDGIGYSFYIDIFPTMNCQVNSIGAFDNLLRKDNILDILKWLRKEGIISKKQILVDVNSALSYSYVTKIKEIFESENIVFEQQYTSTNNSIMTMMLLKTEWLNVN